MLFYAQLSDEQSMRDRSVLLHTQLFFRRFETYSCALCFAVFDFLSVLYQPFLCIPVIKKDRRNTNGENHEEKNIAELDQHILFFKHRIKNFEHYPCESHEVGKIHHAHHAYF